MVIVDIVVGCWHGYLSGVRCRLAYGPADATATHCKIQIGFTFLVPAHLGSSGKRAVKRVLNVCIVSVNRQNTNLKTYFVDYTYRNNSIILRTIFNVITPLKVGVCIIHVN